MTRAERLHPFPSRTRSCNAPAPTILAGRLAGTIGRCRPLRRGVEQWQLVGLITRRSPVRIRPPLPRVPRYHRCRGAFSCPFSAPYPGPSAAPLSILTPIWPGRPPRGSHQVRGPWRPASDYAGWPRRRPRGFTAKAPLPAMTAPAGRPGPPTRERDDYASAMRAARTGQRTRGAAARRLQ